MNPIRQEKSPASKGGFTLLEILVAASISLVLIAALLGITSNAADVWTRTNAKIETGVEGRIAFEVLTRDLQSALLRVGRGDAETLHLTNDNGLGNPTTTGDTAWLVFFAPALDRDTGDPGDVCAVSYRLAFQDPIASPGSSTFPMFGLYRAVLSQQETFDDVLGTSDLMADYWDANAAESTAPQHFLCGHVADFQVTLWYRDPTSGLLTAIPAGEPVRISDVVTSPGLTASIPRGALDSIEVSISILTGEGAQIADRGTLPIGEILAKHGRTFVRRIEF